MKKKVKRWGVYTVEHKCYSVLADNLYEAKQYIMNQADLNPRDKRITGVEFGDFEIITNEE